jgi:hypothetical protein
MKADKKYSLLLFAALMSLGMFFSMSLFLTFMNVGFDFFLRWLRAFLIGFIVNLPASLAIIPMVRKIVDKITSDEAEGVRNVK